MATLKDIDRIAGVNKSTVSRALDGSPGVGEKNMFDMIDAIMNMGFGKIALLDCHGNHDGLLRTVMREIADRHGKFICTLSPVKLCEAVYRNMKKDPQGDIHGGEWETSMILAFRPELVNKEEYTGVDAIRCNNDLHGPVSTWGLQNTKTGLFGDPT